MGVRPADGEALLTPAQVASILYVDPKTVTRWAIAGKITAIRTPGGHRRYLRSEIVTLRHGSAGGSLVPTPTTGRATPAPGDVALVAGAVADAADLASVAAGAARRERALAARLAAETVARRAAETAATLPRGADAATRRLAEAASLAATLVAAANAPGAERENALTALRVAVVVQDAAVASAGETAAAAASVATAVAAAAVDVALVVSAADLAIESEVASTARALQSVASAAAREAASEAHGRVAGPDRPDRPAVVPARTEADGRARRATPVRRTSLR